MKHLLFLSLFVAFACMLLCGCDPNLTDTASQTDEMVYDIIDDSWDASLGAKSNYRIQSDPNQEQVAFSPESGVLSLPQAVSIATVHNNQYNTEKELLYLVALDQTEVRHVYEPMPILGADGGVRRDDGQVGSGAFSRYGFNQLLATGAQIGADVSLGWLDIASGDMRSGFSSVATAIISQPLLRGAGRKVALENLTQSERDTLYQIRSFNRFRKSFVTSVATEYYRVLQLHDRQANAGNYYIELVKICDRLQIRAKGGRLPKHELEQAEQDRLVALADYVQARKDYEKAIDDFKVQLSIRPDMDFQLDIDELAVLRDETLSEFQLSEQESIEIALNQRLDLSNVADSVEDAQRHVELAADAIRAELNLVGYANPQSPRRTIFGAEPGELESTRDRYQLSLELDLPIDRLAEKNNYRRSLIALMQHQRLHKELTDTIVAEVRESYRNMEEARRRYDIERKNSRLAKDRTEHTFLLLQYDRANTRDVLDAHEDWLDARDASTEALIDYAVASLNFLRDTGTMKVKPDGMWDKTTYSAKSND